MTHTMVDLRSPAPAEREEPIRGYAATVIEVSDPDRAADFYVDLLGFTPDGAAADGRRLRLGAQTLVLSAQENPKAFPGGGAHVAYSMSAEGLASALSRLTAAGIEVARYHEDRPEEREQNHYCVDPDGNRVQLVQGNAPGIDHVAIETHDVEWAEVFYVQILGGEIGLRVGWRMEDFELAVRWGNGEDACAPGTRRWDKRYTSIEGNARVPRPNAHFFVRFGNAAVLGVYLATEHRQEPPPRVYRGTPRTAFQLTSGALVPLQKRLREIRLRCMQADPETGGPFTARGKTLFVRDPGGNFLEFREA